MMAIAERMSGVKHKVGKGGVGRVSHGERREGGWDGLADADCRRY
jgi:hypothetical protein